MKLQIEVDSKGAQEYIKGISENIFTHVEQETTQIVEDTLQYIHELIGTSKIRPDRGTNLLEKSIEMGGDSSGYEYEAWIGDISKMNQEVPHWRLIDEGGIYTIHKDSTVPLTYFDGSDGFIKYKANKSLRFTNPMNFTLLGKTYLVKNIQKAVDKAITKAINK